MEQTSRPEPGPIPFLAPETPAPPRPPFLQRLGGRIPPAALRRGLLALAIAVALVAAVRLVRGSFQSVRPGEAGVAVNALTGHVRVLPPGTHFLPGALYTLHRFRVSDQLLAGPGATFSLVTRDGIPVTVSLQVRWALQREELLARWASLPPDPAAEVIGPVLASAFRSQSTAYEATALAADKRDELAAAAARRARERLAGTGIVLKDVLVGDLKLPAEYERGRMALLEEQQASEKKEATLKIRQQEIEEGRLTGEAEKVRREKAAETEAAQRLIAARAESDAMQYILPLKEKAIRQSQLEAEAERARVVEQAKAAAETSKIQAEAEAQRRRLLADAEAYSIRTTSAAQFENLKREAELVTANPIWVSKTFAERISDKVQVILTPQLSSDVYTDEVMKRLANGEPAVADRAARRAGPQASGATTAARTAAGAGGGPEREGAAVAAAEGLR